MCYSTVEPSFERADYKTANGANAWELIEELRSALAHFGITVANDPAFDGSGTPAVIISRDDISTEDLAKTLKADMPEMYQGMRARTIASKLRTEPLFSRGDKVITRDFKHITIYSRKWFNSWWYKSRDGYYTNRECDLQIIN